MMARRAVTLDPPQPHNSLQNRPFGRAPAPHGLARPLLSSCARKDCGMRYTKTFVLVVGFLLTASLASAQKPVNFSLGGGLTTPNAEVKDRFGNGYNFNFGV